MKDIIDVSKYQIDVSENTNGKYYTFTFTKYIDGLKTTDSATVSVFYNGEIYSYSSYMLGKISDDANVGDIDFEKVSTIINEKLDKIFEPVKSKYDKVEYNVSDTSYTELSDGTGALVCSAEVVCSNNVGEYTTSVSERISLVVILD